MIQDEGSSSSPETGPTEDPDAPDKRLRRHETAMSEPIRRFFDGINTGNRGLVEEVVTPNYVVHFTGNPQEVQNVEGLGQHLAALHSAFPDLQTIIEDMTVAENQIVVRDTWQGTHQGDFAGIPPSGKHVAFKGIDVFRVVDGKIMEHWSSRDDLDLMQQLGMTQPPVQTEP